jgi:UDP-N-acetyl-D-mannosaminuronate dehydrogenase
MKVGIFRNPDTGEVSKLLETTWLGVLIGWAQEMERMAAQCEASYEEVNVFIEEINFLPSHVFPGHIGGHCVMPNIAILRERFKSKMLDAIVESNDAKGKIMKLPPVAETVDDEKDDARVVR